MNTKRSYTEKEFLEEFNFKETTIPNQKIYQRFFKNGNTLLECRTIPIIGLYASPDIPERFQIKNITELI